jgi:trehalose 6-phosphate synthase
VLWPVFHNRLDVAQFEAGYFQIYSEVNKRFAHLLRPFIGPEDLVWVHDYHLIPLAMELRKLGVLNRIGFFLHIPFPPAQAFLAVPEYGELTRALSAYDLIGLQTKADVSNFLDHIEHSGQGCLLPSGKIRLLDRRLTVASFPVGIDPTDFSQLSEPQNSASEHPETIRIIGVDRLDYSKGLPQKFRAFSRFLDIAPEYRGKAVLTQIAPPTRETVGAYTTIRKDLESLTGSVNGRLGDLQWVPIHYIHRSVPRGRLGAIYRSSRVGLITPLRDGMNLVAKEYVAAQDPDDPGVLILSRFAGAAEDMAEALIVNPYNVEEVAAAIRTAIEMKPAERRSRHAALMATVERTSSGAWSSSFLKKLRSCEAAVSAAEELSRLKRLQAAMTKPTRSKRTLERSHRPSRSAADLLISR